MTILIVDDDVSLARALKRLLEAQQGHVCLVAHSVDDAMATLAAERPDFVLTDFDLGTFCNGADLACWARHAFGIPSAIMTGHDLGLVVRELRELGLRDVDVIPKPFAIDALVAQLAPYAEIGPWAAARSPRAS